MKRAEPLRRSGWLRRRTPLRPVSPKRRAYHGKHAAMVQLVLERDQRCQLRGSDCFGPLTPHHLLKSSQGGTDDPQNMVALCQWHNGWVEREPITAQILGLVIKGSTRYHEGRLIR